MIDWDRVVELKEEIGEADFREVVVLFLNEVDEVIARLANYPDAQTLGEDLHFLKGSALNLGFLALGTLCQQIGGGLSDPLGKPPNLERLFDVYAQSRDEFLKGALDPLADRV